MKAVKKKVAKKKQAAKSKHKAKAKAKIKTKSKAKSRTKNKRTPTKASFVKRKGAFVLHRQTSVTEVQPELPAGGMGAVDGVATEIMKRLRETLAPNQMKLGNMSEAHKKHKSAKTHGGGHYSLMLVTDMFEGMNRVARQQWVHELLKDLFTEKKIHALEMTLKAPDDEDLFAPEKR